MRMDVREDVPVKGAIFDQDGLLFDTERIFEQAWLDAGKAFGLPMTLEIAHRMSGRGRRELARVARDAFPGVDAEALVERTHTLAAAVQLAGAPTLKPGVREMLAACRARGLGTAVASSSMRHLVDHNLAAAGLTEFFDVIVTGRDVRNGKPAPDIFLLAAERLGLAPADCIVFEDALPGVAAALAAGCRAVMIPDRVPPPADLSGGCRVYPTLSEARTALGL